MPCKHSCCSVCQHTKSTQPAICKPQTLNADPCTPPPDPFDAVAGMSIPAVASQRVQHVRPTNLTLPAPTGLVVGTGSSSKNYGSTQYHGTDE